MPTRQVVLNDGRSATLVETEERVFLLIEKEDVPPASCHHSYTAVVNGERRRWETVEHWPAVEGGTWAYGVREHIQGFEPYPWFPLAGGHGKSSAEVEEELRQW